jgi:hypothetical protein
MLQGLRDLTKILQRHGGILKNMVHNRLLKAYQLICRTNYFMTFYNTQSTLKVLSAYRVKYITMHDKCKTEEFHMEIKQILTKRTRNAGHEQYVLQKHRHNIRFEVLITLLTTKTGM